ncbi:unnamed protein product [Rotaria socialis]|uniref:D-alanyl-D-alanine carboxypeptidase-like core domain-containing protein n=3 Tax=Rotaria socialis TaxID=392032 RepID=A0A818MTN6_9BILA|nr:unnamed protein product [Rotaria socialis]
MILTLTYLLVFGPSFALAQTACTAKNAKGTCIATSSCSGTSVAGLCPGAANIQCCIPKGTACTANGKSGSCIATSSCAGTSVAGLCPGAANIQCCVAAGGTSGSSSGLCGSYVGAAVSSIKGNNNVMYSVVKIRQEHLTNPGIYSSAPTAADNTMTTSTACAFDKMAMLCCCWRSIKGNNNVMYSVVKIRQEHLTNPGIYSSAPTAADNTMTTSTACAFDKMASAAKQAGARVTVTSGFRTVARQEYFWNCYQTKACNNGNLAARPGTSKHGRGVALDLNTNCGSQTGAKPNCGGSSVYQWLKNNGHKYGFKRTVQSEPWHWEYVGASATPSSFT